MGSGFDSILPELPRPKSGMDLNPTPSVPELPRPQVLTDFGASAIPELPKPKSGAGFGSPDSVPQLPRPKSGAAFGAEPSLPELPRPKSEFHASPSSMPELPRPGRTGLPTPSYAGGQELPGTPQQGAGPLPTRKIDFDSLPLASGGQSTKQGLPTRRYDSELGAEFSSPMAFGGSPMPGSQGDESLPLPDVDFAASGFDLGLDGSAEHERVPSMDFPGAEPSLRLPSFDTDALEDKEPETTQRSTQKKTKTTVKPAKGAKPKKSKRRERRAKAKTQGRSRVYLLGLLGLIGVGALSVALFGDGGDDPPETEMPVQGDRTEQAGGIVAVNPPDLAGLFGGNFGDYSAFVEEAANIANMNDNQHTESVAILVVGQALMAIQYGSDGRGTDDIAHRASFLGPNEEPRQALARGAEFARQGNLIEAQAVLEPLYLGEDAHWAHLFTGLAEIQRYRNAVVAFDSNVPIAPEPAEEVVPDLPPEEGEETAEETQEEAADDTEEVVEADDEAAEQEEEDLAPVLIEPPVLSPIASESLETAATLEPRLATAAYFLAVCAELQGETESAIALYSSAVDRFPGHIPSQLAGSRLLVATGEFEDAAGRLALLAESHRDSTTANERSEIQFLLGESAIARRRFERAVEAYQQALIEDKTNDAALWAYVHLQERLLRFTTGLAFLRERVSRGDQDVEYILARSLLEASQADHSTEPDTDGIQVAIGTVSALAAANPDDSRLHYTLGRLRQADGRFDLAASEYEEAINLAPDIRTAYLQLVELAEMQNDLDLAMERLTEALNRGEPNSEIETDLADAFMRLGDAEQAAEHYRLAIVYNPYSLEARFALTRYLIDLGEEENFLAALDQLNWIEGVGVDEELMHSLFAEAHYGLGDLPSAQQRMDRVTADEVEGVRNSAHLYLIGRINFDLGMIALEEGRVDESNERFETAETHFDLSFTHGRSSADTRYWQGRSLIQLNQFSDADRTLRTAITLAATEQDERGAFYYYLGDALIRADSHDQALDAFQAVDRIDLAWAMANPEVFFRRGQLNLRTQHRFEAERDLRWMLMLEPQRADAAATLAKVYADLREFEKAISYYRRSLDLAPENAIAHNQLGMLYNRLERKQEAIVELEAAYRLGYAEIDPALHRVLGYLYRDFGRRGEAIEQLRTYRRAARLVEGSPESLEIENQIVELGGR